ncbi:MAG: hypothetical protein ACTTJ6_01910 [Treponema sp.]
MKKAWLYIKNVLLYIKNVLFTVLVFFCVSQVFNCSVKEIQKMANRQFTNRQDTKGDRKVREIDRLRQDTKDIININFFYCSRIRNIALRDENDQIFSYREDVANNLKVRLSSFDVYEGKKALVPKIEISKIQYLITVEHDVDIKENDILKIENIFDRRVFRVVEIESYYFGGEKTMETCYKKSGKVELLKVD